MENLTPNALAKRLDGLAKLPNPDLSGLSENQRAYVRGAQKVLEEYRRGQLDGDRARVERRSLQIRYLQKPIIQEIVERWTREAQEHEMRTVQ